MLKKIVLWCAVVMLSCQIFMFSSATATESSGVSGKIAETVIHIVKKTVPASAQNDSWERNLYDVCHKLVRKMAHFSIYALLASLSLFLARSYQLRMKLSALISASYSLLYAITDEIHQLFVEGRSGQISDVCIDFAGALFGIGISVLIWYLLVGRKRKKMEI